MIVSHRHRLVFFAVPRTGTHTVRAALFPLLGEQDWEQQALSRSVRLPVPRLAELGHGHISYQQLLAERPDLCADYLKFAFVRNPYDRFISVCAFLTRQQSLPDAELTAFMKEALTRDRFRARILVRPQSELLMDAKGAIAMDMLGHYESLDEDLAEIFARRDLPVPDLTTQNASTHRHFGAYYDAELLDQVNRFYAQDFALLDYPLVTTVAALQ